MALRLSSGILFHRLCTLFAFAIGKEVELQLVDCVACVLARPHFKEYCRYIGTLNKHRPPKYQSSQIRSTLFGFSCSYTRLCKVSSLDDCVKENVDLLSRFYCYYFSLLFVVVVWFTLYWIIEFFLSNLAWLLLCY
jgi:hypothetical protein